jgi:hypothetical protein
MRELGDGIPGFSAPSPSVDEAQSNYPHEATGIVRARGTIAFRNAL